MKELINLSEAAGFCDLYYGKKIKPSPWMDQNEQKAYFNGVDRARQLLNN